MKIPHRNATSNTKDHRSNKYFMSPKRVKYEIIKHDNSSVLFFDNLCKY